MKNLILLLLSVLPMTAGTITITGTMSLEWQFDLATNQFTNIVLPSMPVSVVITEPYVTIEDPLFSLLGYNTGVWQDIFDSAIIQNEPAWNATWITLIEHRRFADLSGPDGPAWPTNDTRWMEFNNGTLGNLDLDSALLSQISVGGSWSLRDDGMGYQNLLTGTIESITVTETPEPALGFLCGLCLCGLLAKKTFQLKNPSL